MTANEEVFDKHKDFVVANSPISNNNKGFVLSSICNLINLYQKQNIKKRNKDFDFSTFDFLLNIIKHDSYNLHLFYENLYLNAGQHSNVDEQKEILNSFFSRNDFYEKFLINTKNHKSLEGYINCWLQEYKDFTKKVFDTNSMNFILNYLKLLKLQASKLRSIYNEDDVKNTILSLTEIIKNSSEKQRDDAANLIAYISSHIIFRRFEEVEDILFNSNAFETIIKYALQYHILNDKIINSLIQKSLQDRGTNCISNFVMTYADTEEAQFIDSIPALEKFFIENVKTLSQCKDSLSKYITRLKDHLNFYNLFAALESTFVIDEKNFRSSVCQADTINAFNYIYSSCFARNIPVKRLDSHNEKIFILRCQTTLLPLYIKAFDLLDYINVDDELAEILLSRIDFNVMVAYAINNNKRYSLKIEDKIFQHNYKAALKYAIHFKLRVENIEDKIFCRTSLVGNDLIAEKIRYMENVADLSGGNLDFLQKYEGEFFACHPVAVCYSKLTKTKNIKYENSFAKSFNGCLTSNEFISHYHLERIIVYLKNYFEYCSYIKKPSEKIEKNIFGKPLINDETKKNHSMEQIQLIEKCYETISNMLIDYIKNVVKMPKELYDNSCIGKHPDYLKFKEDYEKQVPTGSKGQRRKASGINP